MVPAPGAAPTVDGCVPPHGSALAAAAAAGRAVVRSAAGGAAATACARPGDTALFGGPAGEAACGAAGQEAISAWGAAVTASSSDAGSGCVCLRGSCCLVTGEVGCVDACNAPVTPLSVELLAEMRRVSAASPMIDVQ